MTKMNQYILRKKFWVSSAEVDFEKKIKVSALVNIFIQSAMLNAEDLRWQGDPLATHNLAWVLSSLKVEIIRYPQWKEHITCETWAKGVERLFYKRDFLLYDEDDTLLAKCTSNWLLIDLHSRRPKMLQFDDTNILTINKDRHAIAESIATPNYNHTPVHSVAHIVKYSDIDMNQHMTTTRYIDLIFDTYTQEEVMANRPKELTMAFVKEVKIGERIEMSRSSAPNGVVLFRLISDRQLKPCFVAESKV